MGTEKFGSCETHRELESQRLKLHQANKWADQALREKINLFGELQIRNRIYQQKHTRTCQEIEELRRICYEETDRARQARIDNLSVLQERSPTTVSQLLTDIQDLQNQANSLTDARNFDDPDTASSSGASPVPSQLLPNSKSQNNALPRFWIGA